MGELLCTLDRGGSGCLGCFFVSKDGPLKGDRCRVQLTIKVNIIMAFILVITLQH